MRIDDFLEGSATRHPDKIALVCASQRVSYRELDDEANRLAGRLIALGVGRGDRVAVCLDNSVEAVVSIFAILKAGAIFVLLNPATKPEKLAFMLRDADARRLITRARKAKSLENDLPQVPLLETLVIVGDGESDVRVEGKRTVSWDELLYAERDAPLPPRPAGTIADLAALIYTSGSTGRPKGVTMGHDNMLAAASAVNVYLEHTADDVILSVLPLSFSYGLYQLLTAFLAGATVVLEKSFAFPHAVLQRMAEERVTGFAMVPTIAAILLQQDLASYRLEHLRYLTNAGAALPSEHVSLIRERFPRTGLFLMYGLTECMRVAYLPPDELSRRPGSVGRPMDNVEVRIVDESGRRLPAGEPGELVVRGPNVMRGYWNLPEETRRALTPAENPGESLLHTGDLFRTDADGYLYFVGRRDDIIRSGGEKVSPVEVENVLYRLDGIDLAAVVGVPDPLLGSVVKAVVTLKEGARLDRQDILRHCAGYLEDIMIPKILEFRSTMPRNEAGKIDKRALTGREDT